MARDLTSSYLYCLKVTLRDSDPPIWRMIAVSPDMTLADLHVILQAVMGWEEDHQHQFVIGRRRYGIPDGGWLWFGSKDEVQVQLGQVVRKPGTSFLYEYDFGDQWEHDIEFLHTMDPALVRTCPTCLDGQGKCPPEDCGGIEDYQAILSILADPQHPDHVDVRQDLGKRFNPAAFSKSTVNTRLKNRLQAYSEDQAFFK